jgi:hypothetical protein
VSVLFLVGKVLPLGLPAILGLLCKISLGAVAYSGFLLLFERAAVIKFINLICSAIGHKTRADVNATPALVAD